jgi:hypothetical protein
VVCLEMMEVGGKPIEGINIQSKGPARRGAVLGCMLDWMVTCNEDGIFSSPSSISSQLTGESGRRLSAQAKSYIEPSQQDELFSTLTMELQAKKAQQLAEAASVGVAPPAPAVVETQVLVRTLGGSTSGVWANL